MTELRELLEKVSVAGTENRKSIILDILKLNEIPYKLEAYEHQVQKEENIIIDLTEDYDAKKNKLLLTAHYDVVPGSTGANDNGSAVSVLLKIAMYAKENGISTPARIVFFFGEEMGGRGSSAYCRKHFTTKEECNSTTVINLDVIGCGDYLLLVNRIKNKKSIANKLPETQNMFGILGCPGFPFSDADIFAGYGVGTVGISAFPKEDVAIMNGEYEEKEEPRSPFTRTPFHMFGEYVFEYMHNGKYDDIRYINYNLMNTSYEFILTIL